MLQHTLSVAKTGVVGLKQISQWRTAATTTTQPLWH